MRFLVRAAIAASMLAFMPMAASADPLTYPSLKTMVAGLGYTPKDLGGSDGKPATKLEITVVTGSFNVPLGLELTPSGRFIWVTANLGDSTIDGGRALQMLKRSKDIQPTQFWITQQNALMIGIAVNNVDMTPDLLKFTIDKVAADIEKTSDLWQSTAQ